MMIPFPILIGLFYAINERISSFQNEHWLWIGSAISHQLPQVFATSLAVPDIFLLLLYVVSMYFTVRYGSPPSQDPQQAQTQKIMAFVSPAMIAYFGFQYKWASALYIYWLALNVFTVAQQLWMYKKFGIGTPAPAAASAPAKNVTASAKNTQQPRAKKRANR
jgi:membrane protein insertase Oxa1/YidC/SpoIIIJ